MHTPIDSSGGNAATCQGLIRDRRQARGLTLDKLAKLIGCSKGYLSAIENGRKGPPGEDLAVKLEQVLGIEQGQLAAMARWAKTPVEIRRDVGELERGQRTLSQLRSLIAEGTLDDAFRSGKLHDLIGVESPTAEPVGRILPLEVPLINNVAAGYPAGFTDLDYPARIADEYIRAPDVSDPDAFAARVVGDSMAPEYHEGDVVIFSPAREVQNGDDCFLRFEPDHESTFKRVYFETAEDGSGRIRIQPVNNAYPPRTVDREEVAGMYAAISVTRTIRRNAQT